MKNRRRLRQRERLRLPFPSLLELEFEARAKVFVPSSGSMDSPQREDPKWPESLGISLNRACCYHKPSTSRQPCAEKEVSIDAWDQRRKIFKRLVSDLDQEFTEVQKSTYTDLLENVVHFIVSSEFNASTKYIPTALARLGVSISDHQFIFDLLAQRLRDENVASFVVRFDSSDVASMAKMMNKLLEAVIDENVLQSLGIEKESKWQQNFSYKLLVESYEKYVRQEVKGPLVIILQEMDSMDSSALRCLIPVIKSYVHQLPVLMIWGTSTNAMSPQNVLPAKATDCLVIKSFNSKSAKECVEEVLNKAVISSQSPFKVGPQVLNLIIDNYLFYDFSLHGMMNILKFCLFDHFYSNPYSILCQIPETNAIIARLSQKLYKSKNSKTEAAFKALKKLPSVSENNLPQDYEAMKDFVDKCLVDLRECHATFVVNLTCLHFLTKDLPNHPLGPTFHALYAIALEKPCLCESEEYKEAAKYLNCLSSDDWKDRIEMALNNADGDLPFVITLRKHYSRIEKLHEPDEPSKSGRTSEVNKVDFSDCKSRSEWQQKVKAKIGTSRVLSKFELWRNEVIASIESAMKGIRNPLHLPLHEIVYYDNISSVKKHCLPSPRNETMKMLRNPLQALGGDEMLDKDEDNSDKVPDISRIFKLYEESGALINLYDWFDTFRMLSEEVKTSPRKKKKADKSAEEQKLVSRFFAAVGDLEYLGFVKPAARKCDTVTKLVWQ